MAQGPAAYAQWVKKMRTDARYATASQAKSALMSTTADGAFTLATLAAAFRGPKGPSKKPPGIHRDWSASLGTSGSGHPGTFPAKFQFDIYATPSCTNDFVVFPTNAAGVASTTASVSGTFTGTPNTGASRTVTITNGATSIVLVSSAASNTGLNFQSSATTSVSASNLAAAINRNNAGLGVTAGVSGSTVTVTATAAGAAGNSITVADNVSNFAWNSGNLTGGADGQPTILAYNNLYKTTCPSTVPNPTWAFNTGTGSIAELSPVLSLDGTQVAFIQRNAANQAMLVVLKWKAGSGSLITPTALASTASGSYRACSAPCMTTLTFSNSANDWYSSPFYAYESDELFVGDNAGVLHKFTGVFNGTPAEVTTGGFAATVNAGTKLTSPVYDRNSGFVFVGSDWGTSDGKVASQIATGAKLHSVNASTGVVTSSVALGRTATTVDLSVPQGVRDAPIVDGSAKRVYAFVESSPDPQECGPVGAQVECKRVYQFSIPMADGASWNAYVPIGRGQKWYRTLYSGTFDNTYYNSADPTNPSGNMYVCGSEPTSVSSQRPTLWKIPITNNVMGTPVVGPTPAGATLTADCSPVTEIVNGITEYLFMSVPQPLTDPGGPGNPQTPNLSACSGAGDCTIYMYTTSGTWDTAKTPGASLATTGGTSGIIVDNVVTTTTGAAQVYYGTTGTLSKLGGTATGTAIQASQTGLQ